MGMYYWRYCTFVPPHPIVIDDSSLKNAAESFTVALTLTLGGYESAIAPYYFESRRFQKYETKQQVSLHVISAYQKNNHVLYSALSTLFYC